MAREVDGEDSVLLAQGREIVSPTE